MTSLARKGCWLACWLCVLIRFPTRRWRMKTPTQPWAWYVARRSFNSVAYQEPALLTLSALQRLEEESSLASLRSSILQHKHENGRRYHSMSEGSTCSLPLIFQHQSSTFWGAVGLTFKTR